nr:MAG TPA: hypothetical protein [Caudoviricetes sp.]
MHVDISTIISVFWGLCPYINKRPPVFSSPRGVFVNFLLEIFCLGKSLL